MCGFSESSAITGEHVEVVFEELARLIIEDTPKLKELRLPKVQEFVMPAKTKNIILVVGNEF